MTDLIIYMKKFLHSDWLRGVQFYFKLHCMQCKLTKQEQRLETSWKSNMASGISSVNFHLFSGFFCTLNSNLYANLTTYIQGGYKLRKNANKQGKQCSNGVV